MNDKTDLRVKKTYMALCKSFKELLEMKSFSDITVNEICDNAMVGRGTFYSHFNSKYEFLSFFIGNIINDCADEVLDGASYDNICDYYKNLLKIITETLEANKYIFGHIDNCAVTSITLSSAEKIYNKLLKHIKVFYAKDERINCFRAKCLTIILFLVVFDFVCGSNTADKVETKESISVFLDKLFA